MAIKVLTQIGTDSGITSELYIRISNYQISKFGSANLSLQLFLKEEDSKQDRPYMMGNGVRNNQIGDNIGIPLTKEIVIYKVGSRFIQKEVTHTREVAVDGAEPTTETYTTFEPSSEEYTYEEKTTVPDLSPLVGVDIFTFAYGKLKEKLEGLFPKVEIVDC